MVRDPAGEVNIPAQFVRSAYTQLLSDSRLQAMDRLRDAARWHGANAVPAMRFDCNEIADIMSEVAAYGTAVTVRRL
jgi:uncharacterized protein YbjQ (UPF0145 family)